MAAWNPLILSLRKKLKSETRIGDARNGDHVWYEKRDTPTSPISRTGLVDGKKEMIFFLTRLS
jgi:hypothetical protein